MTGEHRNSNNPTLSEPSLNMKDESMNLNDSRVDMTTMLYFRAKHKMQKSKSGFLGKNTTELTLANLIEKFHIADISSLNDRIDELISEKEDLQFQVN